MADDFTVEVLNTKFRLSGGPLDAPNTAEHALLGVGYLTSSWARFERHLDMIAIHINKPKFEKLFKDQHPTRFGDKINLLTRYFSELPALAPFADDMARIIKGIEHAADKRHTLAHGIFEHYDPETDLAHFSSYRIKKGILRTAKHTVPVNDMFKIGAEINKVNTFLAGITRKLFTHEMIEQLQKPAQQTPS